MSSGNERSTWSNKTAFILAAAASAVGLGNMWRFPYLAAKFGGGTFIFTYFALAFTFGISLLLLEIALGRHTKLSCIGAFGVLGSKFKFVGVLAALVPFIITPYYCIIGGWVIKFMVSFLHIPVAALRPLLEYVDANGLIPLDDLYGWVVYTPAGGKDTMYRISMRLAVAGDHSR